MVDGELIQLLGQFVTVSRFAESIQLGIILLQLGRSRLQHLLLVLQFVFFFIDVFQQREGFFQILAFSFF